MEQVGAIATGHVASARAGAQILAVTEDREAASAIGIDAQKVYFITFIAGATAIDPPVRPATSAAATDVVAGQLPMTFGSFPGVMPFVTSGKLRVLGVASDKPTSLAPDIPPLGKDLAVTSWYGLFAPAGTPQPIVDRLYQSIRAVLARPEMGERFKTLGAERVESDPQSFKAMLPGELARWKQVVKDSGAHID